MVHYCDSNYVILALFVILIIMYMDDIFTTLPIIKTLFTDKINSMLLCSLIILLLIIKETRSIGILLIFLLFYTYIYIVTKKSKKVSFANIDTNIYDSSDNIRLPSNIIVSDSEYIYDHSKPIQNVNLMPLQPADMMNDNSNESPTTIKMCQKPDYITRVDAPNRDSYDVTGCRYDFKDSPQNLTKFGPPLSQCGTYNGDQAKLCGTLFYPLSA
jgi:hypothetical protein